MKMPTKTEEVPDTRRASEMIRKARTDAEITLVQLADEMNTSAGYLHDLETGRREWSERLFQLASLSINKLRTQQTP